MTITLAILLGGLTSVWRFYDGSDRRWAYSKLYAAGLVLCAGLLALSRQTSIGGTALALLIPTLTAMWLLVRGLPGWTEWRPMLLGFALPTLLSGLLYSLLLPEFFASIPFAGSGAIVALTYVLATRLEVRLGSLPGPFTAEQWGRVSYGFIGGGLALV